jgi:hypothetical protein
MRSNHYLDRTTDQQVFYVTDARWNPDAPQFDHENDHLFLGVEEVITTFIVGEIRAVQVVGGMRKELHVATRGDFRVICQMPDPTELVVYIKAIELIK